MSDTMIKHRADESLDHDDHHSPDNLGDRSRRGGAIVFGALVIQRAIGLICLAFIARKLDARDFGLVGMMVVLTSILMIFADLGLPDAVVQRSSLTRRELSAAFWLNVRG